MKGPRRSRLQFFAVSCAASAALLVAGCNVLLGVDFEDKGPSPSTVVSSSGGPSVPAPGSTPDGGFLPPLPVVEGQCVGQRKRCGDTCRDYRDPAYGCATAADDCEPCGRAGDVCYANQCTGPCVGEQCRTRHVSARGTRACRVRMTGDVVCWGIGDHFAPAGTNFDRVVVGDGYGTCARVAGGSLVCWGAATVPPPGSFSAFDIGYNACGIRNGTVVCWRASGDQTVAPAFASGSWTEIATGGIMVCASSASGTLKCTSGGKDYAPAYGKGLAGSEDTICALDEASKPVCWNHDQRFPTVDVPMKALGVTRDFMACGIRLDGTLQCWRLAPLDHAPTPAEIALTTPPPGTYQSLAVWGSGGCAITAANAMVCWGNTPWSQPPP